MTPKQRAEKITADHRAWSWANCRAQALTDAIRQPIEDALAAREKDIARAVDLLRQGREYSDDFVARAYIGRAIEALKKRR